eukprot:5081752-Pleurochrysis_carterae.AAC.1
MYTAASSAAITWMCDVARDEWMARARCAVESVGSRRVTCHSKRPPRWENGRRVRLPSASGASSSARTLANR